ncbi:MAG: CHAT domain-containing protein [Nitrosomonas sp.]|nr:CHAT domain-containing protein [Nitrosomonas sp.]
MISRILIIFLFGLFSANVTGNPLAKLSVEESLTRAQALLEQGHYYLALDEVSTVLNSKPSATEQSRAYGTKGSLLLLMQEHDKAEQFLHKAFESSQDEQLKASYANSLGVLYHETGKATQSEEYFKTALALAGNNRSLTLQIKLNQARNQPQLNDLSFLDSLLSEIASIDSANERTRYYLNLAETAKSQKTPFYLLAQKSLEKARNAVSDINDTQLQLELLDSLSDIHEKQGQYPQALALSEQAALLAEYTSADDLLLQIEWRKGRIYQHLGQDELALTAFGKAVDHVQAIRMDIPVEYEDGRSSFRETMAPIFLGYAHHLLKKSANQTDKAKQRTLQLARQTIEQIKQTELEDFLGGRCLIEGIQRKELDSIDEQAAILYPVILPDRLELLVSIGTTIQQYTVLVSAKNIQETATELAKDLRLWLLAPQKIYDAEAYLGLSQKLYEWIISPVQSDLAKASVKTLVVIPDGVLRLVPFAALHDGKSFLIEKYAVSISPGMSLLGASTNNQKNQNYRTLLAGVSTPGSVVEKLPEWLISAVLKPATSGKEKEQTQLAVRSALSAFFQKQEIHTQPTHQQHSEALLRQTGAIEKLQKRLSLPGVETELNALNTELRNTLLLNEHFTVNNFYQQLSNHPFEIVHIATHGFFSSNADDSFLMAFDDVLKLDELHSFLKSDRNKQHSIHLLTFSACQTAEGDDRAPLGFAGVALKADALSALGSLWPISDKAASQIMVSFYRHLSQQFSKAESLRLAQLELLKDPEKKHPSFWSPFILVGNWL